MGNPWIVVAVTVGLIAASAFFVAVEFALIAARRHRLEDAASASRAARAAQAPEFSVLLAGSQFGSTVCTPVLGAITKPATGSDGLGSGTPRTVRWRRTVDLEFG